MHFWYFWQSLTCCKLLSWNFITACHGLGKQCNNYQEVLDYCCEKLSSGHSVKILCHWHISQVIFFFPKIFFSWNLSSLLFDEICPENSQKILISDCEFVSANPVKFDFFPAYYQKACKGFRLKILWSQRILVLLWPLAGVVVGCS